MQSTLVHNPNDSELNQSFGGKYSGTSLAAPLVTGAAALIKSLRPDLGPKEIYYILTKSADNIEAKNLNYPRQLGVGKLNLARAVEIIEELYPKPPEPKYAREDLPKKAILFYNTYKGKLFIAKFDVDSDGKDEWLTAKPIKNTTVYVWTENGKIKKKIKIKGDFIKGIEKLIKK
jgi:subtilisin family serine protease